MAPDPVHTVALSCHPETPTDAIRAIGARVERSARGALAVTYTLEGDLGRVRVPAPRPSRFARRLWEHTCCEIFIARTGLPAYHEFNLSPSGEWAAYAFAGYRAPGADAARAEELEPQLARRGAASTLELAAVIRLERLSALHAGSPLSLGLSAVVEDERGALSYWALKHPAGRPDFHHAEGFALELAGAAG